MLIPNMVYPPPSGWVVETAGKKVEKEIQALSADMRTDLYEIVRLIQTYGLEFVREPHVKHLVGKLWEMRMRDKDGIARAAYVVAIEKRVVIVHCFTKKTQRTPRENIELALKRAKEEGLI